MSRFLFPLRFIHLFEGAVRHPQTQFIGLQQSWNLTPFGPESNPDTGPLASQRLERTHGFRASAKVRGKHANSHTLNRPASKRVLNYFLLSTEGERRLYGVSWTFTSGLGEKILKHLSSASVSKAIDHWDDLVFDISAEMLHRRITNSLCQMWSAAKTGNEKTHR